MRACASGNWNDAFDLSVYLDKKAGAARAQGARQAAAPARRCGRGARHHGGRGARGFSRASSGFGKALDALKDNPLPDTLVVTPTLDAGTPAGHEKRSSGDRGHGGRANRAARHRLGEAPARHAGRHPPRGLFTGALLGLGVVLIVSNTIRLDILNRRAEIEVMKLVGASDGFARRPFLYSGIWYGLGGGVLALILVAAAAPFLASRSSAFGGLYGSQFRLKAWLGLHVGGSGLAAGLAGSAPGLRRRGIYAPSSPHKLMFFNDLTS
jgi:cell division transport system permease protein